MYAGMVDGGYGGNTGPRYYAPMMPAYQPTPYWQTVEGQREEFERSLLSQEQQRRQYDSETQRQKYGILQGLMGNAFGGGRFGGGFGGGFGSGRFSSGWGRGSGGIVQRPVMRPTGFGNKGVSSMSGGFFRQG